MLRRELDDPAHLASPRAQLMREACSTPERMLLLACTGAAIALSLFGYKEPEGDGYPLTAVRCIVGLGVLNKMFVSNREDSPLELSPPQIERKRHGDSHEHHKYTEIRDQEGPNASHDRILTASQCFGKGQLSLQWRPSTGQSYFGFGHQAARHVGVVPKPKF